MNSLKKSEHSHAYEHSHTCTTYSYCHMVYFIIKSEVLKHLNICNCFFLQSHAITFHIHKWTMQYIHMYVQWILTQSHTVFNSHEWTALKHLTIHMYVHHNRATRCVLFSQVNTSKIPHHSWACVLVLTQSWHLFHSEGELPKDAQTSRGGEQWHKCPNITWWWTTA